MKYLWNQFRMTRQGTGSTTVSSSAGSSRNTSGIRMEAYYFLSHRITAVNTITLVRRDTALHTASRTPSNQHRLLPFSNSCAKDHSISLNFFFSLSFFSTVQYFASALNHAEVLQRKFFWPHYLHTVVFPPSKHMWSAHLLHSVTRTGDVIPKRGYLKQELYYQPPKGENTEQQGY